MLIFLYDLPIQQVDNLENLFRDLSSLKHPSCSIDDLSDNRKESGLLINGISVNIDDRVDLVNF